MLVLFPFALIFVLLVRSFWWLIDGWADGMMEMSDEDPRRRDETVWLFVAAC